MGCIIFVYELKLLILEVKSNIAFITVPSKTLFRLYNEYLMSSSNAHVELKCVIFKYLRSDSQNVYLYLRIDLSTYICSNENTQ